MIRFDNALWRGVIAEEVTVAAVRRVSAAIARSLHEARSGRRGVFVGYDTRFLSRRMAFRCSCHPHLPPRLRLRSPFCPGAVRAGSTSPPVTSLPNTAG
jgi:hypothetical protein